ncbi:peptidase, S24 family [Legionella donaldsonii]|uniref:Peptidase, S24 family n=1 Tax=Legionella donaldsonii TaxID=45060 RepID=A0A378KL10_9GAMM|nr:XRE family transcriptional regulator [Legionella donaldsonii]STX84893.1 peptidase, S24 family [Legionella donaldsonii]
MKKAKLNRVESEAQLIAHNLRALMKLRGVTEAEIARSLNTSVMTVRRVISGETEDPRISTLKQIADYFGVSIDYLMEENNQLPIKVMEKNIPTFVPILDWNKVGAMNSISEMDFSNWEDWYPCFNRQINRECFALESRPSMQSRFPIGTLFIVNPSESPIDGDLVLIKIKNTNEVFLREVVIEYPKWILQPIISDSDIIFYDDQIHTIVGVIILTVFHARK